MASEQELIRANVPRRYWHLGAKESSRPAIAEITENLQGHFIAGNNFLLIGKDFSTRTAVASWVGIRAMGSANAYFRDKWHEHKPAEPNSKSLPYKIRFTDIQPIVEIRRQSDESDLLDDWVYEPDILFMLELGAGWESAMYRETVDEVLRNRWNDGLMTIVTLAHELDFTKYLDSTRTILDQYKEITL